MISDSLARVLVHVQTHLDDDLRLASLARVAGQSPFHFAREFSRVVGETVKTYTQRLRLERAAVRLLLQPGKIVEVAFGCGFQSHETFSRAFRRHFGVAPRRFRDAGLPTPPRAGAPPRELASGWSISKTTLCELAPTHLAFIRHVGPYEDVPESLFAELGEWARRRGVPGPHVLLGVGHDAPGVTPPERLRFDAALRVPAAFPGRGRVGHQLLAGGLFARTVHAGPMATLPAAYMDVFGRLTRMPRLQLVGLPCVEVYGESTIRPDSALSHTEIHIPVRRTAARAVARSTRD